MLWLGGYGPPYIADLTLSDFCLCGRCKKHLAKKWFAADTDMKQAVSSWVQTFDTNSFYTGI
jgi:hypothetical protein